MMILMIEILTFNRNNQLIVSFFVENMIQLQQIYTATLIFFIKLSFVILRFTSHLSFIRTSNYMSLPISLKFYTIFLNSLLIFFVIHL